MQEIASEISLGSSFSIVTGQPIRELTYNDKSHWEVLTARTGSVWPRVLPFCLVNVLSTTIVYYLKQYNGYDLTSDTSGHRYMAIMMSFLVVTRVKITFDLYMENAAHLSTCYKCCRDLAAEVCALTGHDKSDRAKQYRQDVIYHMLIMLRVTISVLEFKANPHAHPLDVPELTEDDYMHLNASITDLSDRFGHGEQQTELETVQRLPIELSYSVRREILKERDGTWLAKGTLQHPFNEEGRLLECVSEYMKAYSGLSRILTTTLPFPLVQMNKTFLFVWLFSLPFALCHDTYGVNGGPLMVNLIVFLITFGFLGCEIVAAQLADPFGDDTVDFDDLGHAQVAMEDCYIAVFKTDGPQAAKDLYKRLVRRGLVHPTYDSVASELSDYDTALEDTSHRTAEKMSS